MDASIATQRRLIATASLVTFGVGMYGAYSRDEFPSARWLIGMGIAFTFCSIFADFGSGLGAGFAVLIMTVAVLYQGEDVLKQLSKRGAKARPGKRKGKSKKPGGKKTVPAESQRPDDPDDRGDYPR